MSEKQTPTAPDFSESFIENTEEIPSKNDSFVEEDNPVHINQTYISNDGDDSSNNDTSNHSDFWNEGAFKKVTKRIDEGARFMEDLTKMMHERAEIENVYASKLKAWGKKWFDVLQRSGEYGSIVIGTEKLLDEGNSVSDLHFSVYGKLENLSKETLQWKQQRYPKSLTKYKELRRSEEAFNKAQGPWVTKTKEAQKCMKAYHAAKDLLRSLEEQDELLKSAKSETTQDQLNKIANKIKKCELDIENTNSRYHNSIRDITTYNPKYIEDMKYEFDVSQKFEKIRREVIKDKFEQFLACVDRRMFFENYTKVYEETDCILNQMDVNNDLSWYCIQYGPDEQNFKPLEFIEYDPVLHSTTSMNFKDAAISPRPKSKSPNSSVCTAL